MFSSKHITAAGLSGAFSGVTDLWDRALFKAVMQRLTTDHFIQARRGQLLQP